MFPTTHKVCGLTVNQLLSGSIPEWGANQGIAQFGRAPVLGTGGRRFKSYCPDHKRLYWISSVVEHTTDNRGVLGSNPRSNTNDYEEENEYVSVAQG